MMGREARGGREEGQKRGWGRDGGRLKRDSTAARTRQSPPILCPSASFATHILPVTAIIPLTAEF